MVIHICVHIHGTTIWRHLYFDIAHNHGFFRTVYDICTLNSLDGKGGLIDISV